MPSTTVLFPIIVIMVALLAGGILGRLSLYALVIVIATLIVAISMVLRLNELTATIIIVIQLCVDWYFGLHYVSVTVALATLLVFFLARSPRYPWVKPRALWLWGLLLMLAIGPAIRGAHSLYEAAFYYPNVILGALVMFWLGTALSRNGPSIRCLFAMLAGFATLIAIHTIIQATTGVSLFATPSSSAYLLSASDFQLAGSTAHRAGSFFLNPDWNGAFFAMMLFIPLCLFAESSFFAEKLFYLIETFIMLLALLFTYSAGSSIAAGAGLLAFIVFVGRARYRVALLLLVIVTVFVMIVLFPSQVVLLLQHATAPNELMLRVGAWQTALRVIQAFPVTGVGLSYNNYLLLADPYRVPAQYRPLAHPHEAYLELGAMAGLPVLIVFVVLLLFALWLALRNWILVNVRTRLLLGGGIAAVIALSANSLSVNGWTVAPLAATGWLILGAISSPLIAQSRESKTKM